MIRLASALARGLAAAVPAKAAVVRLGARLPPRLRSQASYRFFSAVAARSAHRPPIVTNMGIDAGYRCEVPFDSVMAALGKPSLYLGERGPLALAQALCGGCDAFVDVGAHLGYFGFYLRARGVRTPIHAFEPDPGLFDRLAANVAANHLPGVRLYRAALSDRAGTSTFYRNLSDASSGSLTDLFAGRHTLERIEVDTVTYAGTAASAGWRRACIKVDVEGAEAAFLAGALPALDSIDSLIIEVLGPAIAQGFVQRLLASGLQAYYINDYRLEHSRAGEYVYQPPQFNWLFCRHAPASLAQRLARTPFQVVSP